MKSYIKYSMFSFLISILLVSCSEEFLDNPPVGAFTEDNYIRNMEELETILYSCYSVLNTYYTDPGAYANLSIQLFVFGNVGSDDAEKGSTVNDEEPMQDISMSSQLPPNYWSAMLWDINYDLIGKCNLVIDKAEEIPVSEEEVEDLEKITDQARYLRAMAYYNLVTMFGDVPLVTHWLYDINEMNYERSPKSEVWKLIEEDLTEASNLPMRSQTDYGRATHGAVHALLGKVYMWQEDYEKAVEAYTVIIESGEYQLMDDYGLIFRYKGENCAESIFEFQEEMGVDGGPMFSLAPIFRLARDAGAGWGWGFDIPTQDLVDEFEPGDPRLLYTVNFIGDIFPGPWGPYVVENLTSVTGYSTRKAWIPWEDRDSDYYPQALNWRYSRYAEVLLFCAEALNQTNRRGEARTYLKMVRDRARNTPKADPQRISTVWDSTYTGDLLPEITTDDPVELQNAIWHEQRVELAQEGHRRWILLRTQRFKERMEAAKGAKGCTVEDHEWLLPIYPDELNASQGKIEQNPGY